MRLGVQCFTLRDAFASDAWGTFSAVRDMGLEFVELAGTYGISPAELSKGLSERGLKACGSHVGLSDLESQFEAVVADHQALDCNLLIVPWVPKEWYEHGWQPLADRLQAVAKRLVEHGMTLGYHNHAFEFAGGQDGFDALLNGAPGLKAQLDVYWIEHAGMDGPNWIRSHADRMASVHLKDGKIADASVHAPAGEGELNWDAVLSACSEAEVPFGVIELDTCPRDPVECVAASAKFFQAVGIR